MLSERTAHRRQVSSSARNLSTPPTEVTVATDLSELQNRLWESADQLRANSGLKASEYASPVLGLIFLQNHFDKYVLIREHSLDK